MAIIGRRMVTGSQLTTSVANYYSAPAASKAQIQALTLTNTSGSPATATIHLVTSGGSATEANRVLSAKAVAAGDSYKVIEAIGHWLEPGGAIWAKASAGTSISLVASGIEVS